MQDVGEEELRGTLRVSNIENLRLICVFQNVFDIGWYIEPCHVLERVVPVSSVSGGQIDVKMRRYSSPAVAEPHIGAIVRKNTCSRHVCLVEKPRASLVNESMLEENWLFPQFGTVGIVHVPQVKNKAIFSGDVVVRKM